MSSLTRFTVRIAAVLMATSLVWLGGEPAFGIGCGEITADTVLDGNLHCTGNGITIGANDITLDLHGFIIDGTGSGIGIYLNQHSNVTVRGPGVVRGFDQGIEIVQGNNNKILRVTVANNGLRGIHLFNSIDSTVKENVAYGNGFTGIQISGGSGNQALNNETHSNVYGIYVSGWNNAAIENYSHSNVPVGIWVGGGHDNTIAENKISRQATGIGLRSTYANIVKENEITDISGVHGVGVGVTGSSTSNNQIRENVIANSPTGVLIEAGDTNTVIAENTFSANGDPIVDNGTGTVVADNICDPPDADPVCF